MLIAVSGLAGVGKTTAVRHLEAVGLGRQVYVGGYIQSEVRRRGLELTPQNETRVRMEMRRERGNDVFAKMVAADLAHLPSEDLVLLDAIYVAEEAEYYRRSFANGLTIIGIDAPMELRVGRLANRTDRPLSRLEMTVRDALEVQSLRIHEIVAGADLRITNDGTLTDFTSRLEQLVRALGHSPR